MVEVAVTVIDIVSGRSTLGNVESIVDNLFSYAVHTSNANKCKLKIHDGDAARILKKTVMKYVKIDDRWRSLCSVLLKSKAYSEYRFACEESSSSSSSDDVPQSINSKRLPIFELPRTEYGKPFIETPKKNIWPQSSAVAPPLLSVSHHGSFVTMATLKDNNPKSSILMGIDLVVIDARPKEGVQTFLSYFSSVFSPKEWRIITGQVSPLQKMREFFCRWALREAYTKALGVGLGMDFGSFEIDCGGENEAWKLCTSCCQGPNVKRIKIIHPKSNEQEWKRKAVEYWDCVLFFADDVDGKNSIAEWSDRSVACLCVGPVPQSQPHSCFTLDGPIQLSLTDLLTWHSAP
eukprot:CAMPEP_0116012176 /NCGR_PEP_ID=MMETSP0321-20121206/4976_1 /TAXON_ID=163516 /ORGANISM="Leptocylindrus danicus var. danicus, Strain B650" /LENGTH=347 /DNA_ID=CAMNT_0003481487 /DNA_START=18 /DNA_END=1058 /DNA_ORIENTATION=-